jgi:hypothetical protein
VGSARLDPSASATAAEPSGFVDAGFEGGFGRDRRIRPIRGMLEVHRKVDGPRRDEARDLHHCRDSGGFVPGHADRRLLPSVQRPGLDEDPPPLTRCVLM